MYVTPPSPHPLRLPHFFTHWLIGLFAAVLLALAGMSAHAAAPAAGASISNQASASYADGSGVSRTVTSNTVSTLVTQVAGMTLTADGAQTATPGSIVYYPHTLTNTGNGSDTFGLSSTNSGAFSMTGVQFYADNGSGQPTGAAITTTGPLAAGAAFKFIAVGTLPVTATATQTNAIVVIGTSVFTPAVTQSNTDTTTVTTNAVVTLTKAVSASSGAPGSGPYTYTLTYTNTGNSTATSVAITDVLPVGMTYVAGSARWSATAATALSDAGGSVGTSPNTLTSTYTSGTKTFLATLNQVTAGQSGTISFQVTVAAATAPGILNNTATTSYNNGAATVSGTSNTVPFTVTQTAAVTISGETVPGPAAPGSTTSFTNVVTNTGTGTDTFNIVVGTGNFPAGTTFQLYKSGGLTPMVDTNGDGIIDTGPLAAGATYNVILKATLPPNASGTGPFSVTKTATSVFDPTKSAVATDQLTAITGASVDLTNDAAGGPGVGNPNITLAVTNSVNPGNTTVFTLVAKNTGPSPDSYNLAASTNATLSTVALPAGWTVTFKESVGGVCTSTGATIINTGSVAAAGSVTVCAVVTVPAGYAAGTSDLYFRTLSPTSGVSDILHDAVTVNAVRSLSITPNGAGQTYPGGSYVYSHTLANTGNVLEGNDVVSAVTLPVANNQSGWTSLLYYDTNGNGVLDSADALITGTLNGVRAGGLAAGASVTIFDKVIAPSGATPGAVNASTITVTTTLGTYTATAPAATVSTDSTTVIAGNLTLEKVQALDADCDGTAEGSYTIGNLSAKPGQCVMYKITVTNVGSADATSVVVSDATPTYTKLSSAISATSGVIATGAPAIGGTGSFSANIGTGATASAGGVLAASQSAVLSFGVKINE
ncbi:NEW3 domain-containing protein [soil metagenome]